MSGRGRHSREERGRFATTQWSLVLAAGDKLDPHHREALASLCQSYWYPVYSQVRYLGHNFDDAQDLTQGFFTHLLEKDALEVARPERGRFRSFLRTALDHFLSHEREYARARKRGGGDRPLDLDFVEIEARYAGEPTDEQAPDKHFERRWARALLGRALENLRKETRRPDAAARFKRLESFLTGMSPHSRYADVASELGMSEVAVATAVHRLRERFGNLLRAEVARTVENQEDVDEELRYLLLIVRS